MLAAWDVKIELGVTLLCHSRNVENLVGLPLLDS